ncbi:MAG: 2-C-methyl-D-erythritol 4-phosphate cytidylyltransferase [Puniceicoccales bacterium]|nr:2-C-methyl-D-erythritol 4-phosphate cytidylyltransferase [Puniceicoccales bacterium]
MQRYAIILVAGTSQRFGQGDKCLALIHGKPIALYAFEALCRSEIFDHYFFVHRSEAQRKVLETFLEKYFSPQILAQVSWVMGGADRMHSVGNALQWIRERLRLEAFIFIHDGARPMLSIKNILGMNALLSEEWGIVLGHRITDTILSVDINGDHSLLSLDAREKASVLEHYPPDDLLKVDVVSKEGRKYPNRDQLWALETPQAFYLPKIFEDYCRALHSKQRFTDDSSLFSGAVKIFENCGLNPKVTFLRDLAFLEKFLAP